MPNGFIHLSSSHMEDGLNCFSKCHSLDRGFAAFSPAGKIPPSSKYSLSGTFTCRSAPNSFSSSSVYSLVFSGGTPSRVIWKSGTAARDLRSRFLVAGSFLRKRITALPSIHVITSPEGRSREWPGTKLGRCNTE